MSRWSNRTPVCLVQSLSIPTRPTIGHNQPPEPIELAPSGFERLLTAAEAAAILSVSLRQVRRWITEGRLPVMRVGRAVRIRPEDLRTFIDQCLQGPNI